MLEANKPGFDDPHLESLLPPVTFSRRGFLASGASVGFAVSAGPVMAETVIRTPADGLEVADLRLPVSGGAQMPGYMAAPAKAGKYPAIIVIPEIFGMHEYQKDICRRLARAGFVGVTLDPYFRFGDLPKLTEIREVLASANKLEDAQMLADLDGVVGFVEKHAKVNARKIGMTGMCRGGRTVWKYAAHSNRLRAGVSWYGGLNPMPPAMVRTPIDVATALNAPVLGLYAGADAGIPVALVARMQEALKSGNRFSKLSRFILYPDVPHAFHADYRPSYRKQAADAAWQEMLGWFKDHGLG